MPVMITADLHLKNDDGAGWKTLETLIKEARKNKASDFIFAGDTLDKSSINSLSQLVETLQRNNDINFHIIPGNHDITLNIEAENVFTYKEPKLKQINGLNFLFLPYEEGTSASERIKSLKQNLPKNTILITHGDYISKRSFFMNRTEDSDSSRLYFPLYEEEARNFKAVVMGHYHSPHQEGNVYYCGSPYPVAKDEYGPRKYIVIDDTGKIEFKTVPGVRVNLFIDSLVARQKSDLIYKIREYLKEAEEAEEVEVTINKVFFSFKEKELREIEKNHKKEIDNRLILKIESKVEITHSDVFRAYEFAKSVLEGKSESENPAVELLNKIKTSPFFNEEEFLKNILEYVKEQ